MNFRYGVTPYGDPLELIRGFVVDPRYRGAAQLIEEARYLNKEIFNLPYTKNRQWIRRNLAVPGLGAWIRVWDPRLKSYVIVSSRDRHWRKYHDPTFEPVIGRGRARPDHPSWY